MNNRQVVIKNELKIRIVKSLSRIMLNRIVISIMVFCVPSQGFSQPTGDPGIVLKFRVGKTVITDSNYLIAKTNDGIIFANKVRTDSIFIRIEKTRFGAPGFFLSQDGLEIWGWSDSVVARAIRKINNDTVSHQRIRVAFLNSRTDEGAIYFITIPIMDADIDFKIGAGRVVVSGQKETKYVVNRNGTVYIQDVFE